jgi:amino acid adenylation domain-containing protein
MALGAYAHQDLPFEQLVDALVAERDRSRTPLFQVFFNYAAASLAAGGGLAGRAARDAGAADDKGPASLLAIRFDLSVMLGETAAGGLVGRLRYSTALFDHATVQRMAGHLVTLLAAAAADPGWRLSELPVLTAGERDQLIRGWNDTAATVPATAGAHDLVTERAAASPDAVAVACGARQLTYRELEERADGLARHLSAAGAGAETVVALCLPRTADMIVAMLAVWKAGAAYLPLDPDYPPQRLEFMLADSRASLLITCSEAATRTGELAGAAQVVWLDDPAVRAAMARRPAAAPAALTAPGQLAYVMYTSGSTGTPKGVQVTHGGVVNLVVAQQPVFRVHPGVPVLGFASFGFDAAVSEAWVTLAAGGRLVLATAAQRAEPELVAGLVRAGGVAIATLPPSLLGILTPGDLDGLRTLVSAGERLDADLARAWSERHRLLNAYGPTEATVCASTATAGGAGAQPIGRPVANTRTYVLDRNLAPAPAGVPGELYIGGASLARGYGGRPSLTAERFIADPFAADGSRVYRTGDRVRWRADGQLEFLGRADEQVKVRGFRVEPGEVEAVLAAHPQVRAAAVTSAGDGSDHRLVAYLVPADPDAGIPVAGELREYCQQRLPEFMVPSVFTALAQLPLTASGKLDRAALPAPDAGRAPSAGQYVAPLTPVEELLAGIWAQLLGLDRVGVTDNFFEMGGHSLMATRAVSRVRRIFGVEVELAALFDQPTVRGLAALVDGSVPGVVLPPVTPVDRDQVLPLSFAQQRLWFLDRLEPDSVEYNVVSSVRLDGNMDPRALGAALTALTARHEVLRTRLVAGQDGAPYQAIDPPSPFPLPVVDLSGSGDPLRAARSLMAADAAAPFDMAAGPLLRATLIRQATDSHVLGLVVHHVVSDEWSGRILRRELLALYNALRWGRPDPLPPLAVQYADFAMWQRRWLTGEVLDGQLAYWRRQLAGAGVVELPADRPRPPVRSTAGAETRFTIAPQTAARLRDVARDCGATMFMTLFAVYAVLLGRYSGLDDIVVGTPVANRNRAETEGLIGFFVNTLVMRADLSGDPAFTGLVGRVRSTALAAYAHQDLPFEQLVDALVTDRDRSRTPLFQVFFNYFNISEQQAAQSQARRGQAARVGQGQGGQGQPSQAHAGRARQAGQAGQVGGQAAQDGITPEVTSKFDLRLILVDDGDGLAGAIEYSTALFDAVTVDRIAGHLVTLLDAVAADAGQRLSVLPVLTAAERDQVLTGWNDTATAAPACGGVHELVAARAAAHPDAVAVVSGGALLTYAGLAARAGRLAQYLRAAGVGPETVVGLGLERGADMVTAILAVWQAGGAYLPLDAGYPLDRLGFMLADSRATVLVGTADVVDDLPTGRLRVITLDDPLVAAQVAGMPAEPPGETVRQGQLAYVIYTSGSTGRPKGVQVTHGCLVNYVSSVPGRVGFGEPGARYALLQAAVTDFGNTVMLASLATGGVLHVPDADMATDPAMVTGYLDAMAIDYLKVVPSHLAALASGGRLAGLIPRRALVLGGEAAPPGWAADLVAVAGDCAVANHYGPTETTIGAVTTVLSAEVLAAGPVPIGSPVANTRVYVLDQWLNPVPAGVEGELWIGGAQVARGYGGRPALTAERFVADRFARDGSRAYRTGDRARWRRDGLLEFAGRADDQVKIRGFRVEPGEVEAALATHPGVGSAVVTADGDGADRRLAAYLVPADHSIAVPAPGELRAYLRQRLPEFMVPSVFTELSALPLTANGKIDRAALPAPGIARPGPVADLGAPATPTEELLTGIWAQVLGVQRVETDDSFFDLGGHSLLATQLISRVRDVFGVEVPLAALFDRPTVTGLASAIEEATTSAVLPPVTPAGRDHPLPLSFAQQRLWFLDQLEPGSAEYTIPMPVRLDGELDAAALGAALSGVVARHEVLRTRLVTDPDGVARQVIDPPFRFPLAVTDVSGEPDPEAVVRALIAADAATPFNLAAGPLIRAVLVQVAADDHVLVLAMHHVVSDEWSAAILRRELLVLYEASRHGEPDRLPPLAVQYADYAVWQRAWLVGEVLDGQLAYWRDQLAGVPVLELPVDRPRPPVRSTTGAVARFVIPAEVADRLRAVARDGAATMFMALFAVYAVLLGRYCDTEDVVAGTPVANRSRAETEKLIGFFANTLVLRADLSGNPSFGEFLGRVRKMSMGAYAHQDLPFEQLVDAVAASRDRSRTPLFQAFFNYTRDNHGHAGPRLGSVRVAQAEVPRVAVYDLLLSVADPGAGSVSGGIEYSTRLFDASTAERMAGHLVNLLEAAAADPDQPLSALAMVTAGERAQLLAASDGGTGAAPSAGAVAELIAARAAATPDTVAVVSGEACLTYGGLRARAARLAGYLRSAGVGAESVVGLCLDRGMDLVIAILAVWQAGGAYLPLDPEYPAERLEFMLADSGAVVLAGHRSVAGELVAGLPGSGGGWQAGRVVWLDDPATRSEIGQCPDAALAESPADGALAAVIYTSGTTGRPKGTLVTHGSLSAVYAAWAATHFGPDAGYRWLSLASASFDVFTGDVVRALCSGGSLVLGRVGLQLETAQWAASLSAARINALECAPRYADALVDHLDQAGATLDGLRLLVVTTDVWRTAAAARARAVLGQDVRVITAYGITETAIDSTCGTPAEQADGQDLPVPIGRPLPGTRVYVLDGFLNLVPPGVAGELWIGGAQVTRGYGGRPGLTAERFAADPFAADGSRAYRSGDRARWRPDGQLEFLGRIDQQVKVRGFRIEPGEVEAALAGHPGVASAVVAARGDNGQGLLVAYLVPADHAAGIPGVGELRAYLGRRLPEFMIPSVFTELAELPLTANGKVDRTALPAPGTGRPDLDGGFADPATPTEELLAGIWAQVLGLDRVGALDGFFDLGGHSLLATQLVSRIRVVFGVEVPLAALFDQPTVRDLGHVIEARIWDEVEQMSDAEVLQSLDAPSKEAKPGEDGIS